MRTRPSQLTAAIAAIFGANVIVNAALHLAARSGVETVWFHDGRLLRFVQGADSWKPMEIARAYGAEHATGLYRQVFFTDLVKFQYPPTALLAFGNMQRPLLNVISWLATVMTAALAALILRRAMIAGPGAGTPRPGAGLLRDALVIAAALTFYPLVKGYSLGQIQAWLDLLFALAMLAWLGGARAAAGVALGLICLIKPTFILLLVWGAVRRQWRFVAGAAVVITAGLAVSVLRYGVQDHLDYLRVLWYISQRGEAFYANQSFNGAFNRLLFNGANLDWQYHQFPPVHRGVSAGTTAAFLILGAAALRRPPANAGSALDLSIAALAVTMTAPLAWEHNYGILVPIYAAVTPVLIARRPLGRWTAAALALIWIVAANYFQFTNRFAGSWLNPLQSYLLAAALLLWGLMWTAAHAQVSPQPASGQRLPPPGSL